MRHAVASALFAVLLCPIAVFAIDDPHDEVNPDRCLSCHSKLIGPEGARDGELYLLKDTIDGLCLICHLKEECCRTGQAHQALPGYIGHSHPSDLDVREVDRASRPQTLPLQRDRITCSTCHLHLRRKPADYKLVRMVTIKDTGVDWSALCADCHRDH